MQHFSRFRSHLVDTAPINTLYIERKVPLNTDDKHKLWFGKDIKVALFPRKTFQADLLTLCILVFLDICLCTLENNLTLRLGSLSPISRCPFNPQEFSRSATQSRKMVLRRLHRQRLVSFMTLVGLIIGEVGAFL